MRSLIALSLVGGLTAPAWARPDGNNDRPPPPSMMRSDVQMHMSPVDGRGDTVAPMRESRPDPWQRPASNVERPPTSAQRVDLPIKSDVAQKMQPGDRPDGAAKPQALDARAANAKPAGDRMGRPELKPALPIKTEVSMKLEHGDNRDAASSPAGSVAKSAARSTSEMTPHDRTMLCKMAGLCLPQALGSDDVADKTE